MNQEYNLAPIVLFAYKRPVHVLKTLESLMSCELASQSVLYIYSDGPKENTTDAEINQIHEVRKVLRQKQWCKEVHIIEAEKNKGLAKSIVDGVTETVNRFDKVIVIEDDLILSPFFLQFMNDALNFYENKEKVMHITGHSFPLNEISSPLNRIKEDTYFLTYVCPHGWATWKSRWNYFENNANILLKKLYAKPDFSQEEYNCGYGNEFYKQLQANAEEKLRSWAVKWHTVIYLMNGLSLFPTKSLIDNTGFDSSGENSGGAPLYYAKINTKRKPEVASIPVGINKIALSAFSKYYKNYFLVRRNKIPLLKIIYGKLIRQPYYGKFIQQLYGRFQSILVGKK